MASHISMGRRGKQILMGRPLGERELVRASNRRKKNMRMELRQIAGEDGIVSGSCPVARLY